MNLKFISFFFATFVLISAAPSFLIVKRDVDPSLIPEFGHEAGLNRDPAGNCDGIKNGKGEVVRIPCSCPPPRDKFIASLNANVDAGFAVHNPDVNVSFPTDGQNAPFTRMMAAIITLQNLDGPGKGCPAASTTFSAQLEAIKNGTNNPPSSSPSSSVPSSPDTLPSSVPPSPSSPVPTRLSQPSSLDSDVVDRNLVPEFGHQSGLNPTGSGDCDGINNAEGKPIKIPCSCPPDREFFIESLIANVNAGHAVNNPSVGVSFPSGDDQGSKLARLHAATVTLQNLHGPGKGCPQSSTTFGAQGEAIRASG